MAKIGGYVLVVEKEYAEDHGDSNYQSTSSESFYRLKKKNCIFSGSNLVSYKYDKKTVIPVPSKRILLSSDVDRRSDNFSIENNTYVSIREVSSDGCFYNGNELVYCNPDLIGSCNPKRAAFWVSSGAFKDCANITEINFPEGVCRIDNSAICNCPSLKKIIIPGSVWDLNINAFSNCKNLVTIDISENSHIDIDKYKDTWFYDKFYR